MTTNQIFLFKAPQGWMAWHKGPHASEIRELFGTDTIPTAFTERAEPEAVRREITKRNPRADVRVRIGDNWL